MSSLSDKAYETLKEVVIEAEEGTFFSVRKSAGELGLSYTPVREALLKLHSEGLLDLVPNVGFFVARMDMRTIVNIYQSRECVEKYVLPMVVDKITGKDLEVLHGLIQKQKDAMKESNISLYTEMDAEFHCYIIDLLHNKQLSEFYKSVRGQYRVGSKKIIQSHSGTPIHEHEEFLNLVKQKKFQEALDCYYEHGAAAVERMKEGYVRIGL